VGTAAGGESGGFRERLVFLQDWRELGTLDIERGEAADCSRSLRGACMAASGVERRGDHAPLGRTNLHDVGMETGV